MKWNQWVRQLHRWLSIVFTVAVLVNIVLNVFALASEEVVMWVGFATLLPLTLLLVTGLYLFLLPYATRPGSRPGPRQVTGPGTRQVTGAETDS